MAENICPSCGAPIDGSSGTCKFCGRPLAHGSAASSQPKTDAPAKNQNAQQQERQRNISNDVLMDPVSASEQASRNSGGSPGGSGSRMIIKIVAIIAVVVIGFFVFRGCGKGKSGSQQANGNQQAMVTSGVDGNSTASGSDTQALYANMKQQASVANKRYAQAWRMVPSEIRSELQDSISTLPKQVDSKCKTLAKQNMTTQDDLERRAIYLKCSLDHENRLSDAIERFAQDYRQGNAGNFLSYVNPEELVNMSWSFR